MPWQGGLSSKLLPNSLPRWATVGSTPMENAGSHSLSGEVLEVSGAESPDQGASKFYQNPPLHFHSGRLALHYILFPMTCPHLFCTVIPRAGGPMGSLPTDCGALPE